MKILALLILSIISMQTVSAYTFLTISINENGESAFIGETDQQLILPEGITLQNGRISGKTNTLTSKQGSLWSVSFESPDAEITTTLPKGATIKSLNAGEVSIRKDRIVIDSVGEINLSYTLSTPTQQNTVLFYIAGAIAIVAIIIILSKYFNNKKSKNIVKKPKSDNQKQRLLNKLLNDREKQILATLKKTGKIKMSHLRKLCEIPKASFSRHIQELEKKQLVKRSGEGKNKFVELT